jgi:hypothetical protein
MIDLFTNISEGMGLFLCFVGALMLAQVEYSRLKITEKVIGKSAMVATIFLIVGFLFQVIAFALRTL